MLQEVFRGGDDARTVNWEITNNGNVNDAFTIGFETSHPDVWVQADGLTNGRTPYIAPGSSLNLTVRYAFGDNAFGDRDITLIATSVEAADGGLDLTDAAQESAPLTLPACIGCAVGKGRACGGLGRLEVALGEEQLGAKLSEHRPKWVWAGEALDAGLDARDQALGLMHAPHLEIEPKQADGRDRSFDRVVGRVGVAKERPHVGPLRAAASPGAKDAFASQERLPAARVVVVHRAQCLGEVVVGFDVAGEVVGP